MSAVLYIITKIISFEYAPFAYLFCLINKHVTNYTPPLILLSVSQIKSLSSQRYEAEACLYINSTSRYVYLSSGMVVNGFVNVVITTIEKRFGLRSMQTGVIAGG